MEWFLQGVISGIAATFLCCIIGYVYKTIKSREIIGRYLNRLYDEIYTLNNRLCHASYDSKVEYNNIINQCHQISNTCNLILNNIMLFTCWNFTKKKFIYSVLIVLKDKCNVVNNTTVGYTGDNEISARCTKIIENFSAEYVDDRDFKFRFDKIIEMCNAINCNKSEVYQIFQKQCEYTEQEIRCEIKLIKNCLIRYISNRQLAKYDDRKKAFDAQSFEKYLSNLEQKAINKFSQKKNIK